MCGSSAVAPHDDPSWHVWIPWGGRARPPYNGTAAIECLGARRLLLLGDSVMMGCFLDLCALFGGYQRCQVVRSVRGIMSAFSDPHLRIAYLPVFAIPKRRGFHNMFSKVIPLIRAHCGRLACFLGRVRDIPITATVCGRGKVGWLAWVLLRSASAASRRSAPANLLVASLVSITALECRFARA